MVTVFYESHAQKAADYVEVVIPAIFEMAFNPSAVSEQQFEFWIEQFLNSNDTKYNRLLSIHNMVRREKYVPENLPQDEIRTMAQTLLYGGDCEDFAAVLLAAIARAGVSGVLVTSGDALDNFKHVYVEAGGYILDPKGSQEGVPFNQPSSLSG